MGVNKVIYGTTVLVDLTKDTVNADGLLRGLTAHGANGEVINGTLVPGGGGIDLSPYKDIAVGTLTLARNATSFTVDTTKGTPAFICINCVNRNGVSPTSSAVSSAYWTQDMNGTIIRIVQYYTSSSKQTTSTSYGTYSNGVFNLSSQLKAGWTYYYCVMYV